MSMAGNVKMVGKGTIMGISNIVPGLSGGTMAVCLGIYDQLIFALTELFKQWRKSLATLVPLFLGCGIGIVAFTYVVEFLLREFALPTCLAFIGLVLGGVPMLWHKYRQSIVNGHTKPQIQHIAVFLLMFSVAAFLPMLASSGAGHSSLPSGISGFVLLFIMGAVVAATMIIPGISGSMVLMMLGYYYAVLNGLKQFFEAVKQWNTSVMLETVLPLAGFGLGIVVGIFLIAKFIRAMLQKYSAVSYSAILGLVMASPIAMLYNTGALQSNAKQGQFIQWLLGIVLMGVCFWMISRLETKGLSHKHS